MGMTDEERITLKEHLERRIDELDKKLTDFVAFWREERVKGLAEIQRRADEMERRVQDRAMAHERAVDKADKAISERLAGMNEIREMMRDKDEMLATREQVDLIAAGLRVEGTAFEKRLRDIETWSANMQGRLITLGGLWGLIVALAAVLINFAIRKAFE